ncbi:MAG: entry exclusion 1 domain-containing protein [Rhodospirillales bacterium]|nr:entry exclusion 1 domain-containing protein [Rhodospirillales bacterium]MCB9965215.1 entry exclusion 1 domain-containing protein [Rhodospirillales bacterium]MCB9979506.1 entry exclusion 1 domain-containing protein [Rhodospirillales bacterium]
MAKVGAQRAADLTGRSKSTIQRAMKAGKLSFERDVNGRSVIDVSELERVFGLMPQQEETKVTSNVEAELKKAADLIEGERMKMKIKMLEEKVEGLETQLSDMRSQRDQWQKQAQQVLLTTEYTQKQAQEYKEKLEERDKKEEMRRKQMLEAKMKRLKGENENSAATSSSNSGGFGFFKRKKSA